MKLILLISTFGIVTNVFAQGKQIPAQTERTVKVGESILLKKDEGGYLYSELTKDLNSVVFEFNHTTSHMENVADDELKEIISFNIKPTKSGKFTIKGNQLVNANAYYYKGCFCADRGTHQIVDGNIRGAKLSKTTWYISGVVKVKIKLSEGEQIIERRFKGTFIPEK
jgi:hypothetical protein